MNTSISRFRRDAVCAVITAVLLGVALMLRAVVGGFSYEEILDDSIQYISYPSSADYGALIEQEGLFASRPLAAVMDLYVIGQMNECLLVPVLLLSLLHGVAAVLFYRLFSRYFGTGVVFAVLYALLPLGVEGTYWLSAASRIVPGLFFTALSATVLDAFIRRGGWWRAPLYFVLLLLSYGFYEQILVLSFTLSALIFLLRRRTKRAWLAFLAIPAVIVYFLFTSANAGGSLSARMEVVLPTTPWYFDSFLPTLVRQIGASFLLGGVRTAFVGFARGLAMLLSDGWGALWLAAALLLGAGLVYLLYPRSRQKRSVVPLGRPGMAAIWGVLLALAPVTPYFVIANPHFSLRATVPSFVGAALLIDLAVRALVRNGRVYASLVGVLATFCLVAGASEVLDYRATAENDTAIAEAILARDSEMAGRVGIFGLEEYLEGHQNWAYHEHVGSACASDWGLYGKLVAVAGREMTFTPVPLGTVGFSFYHGWNTQMKRLSGFDALWAWENGALVPLRAVCLGGENDFDLFRPDGTKYATVWEEEDYGYIALGGRE